MAKKRKISDLDFFIIQYDMHFRHHKIIPEGAEFRVKDVDHSIKQAKAIIKYHELDLEVYSTGIMASRNAFEVRKNTVKPGC